MFVARLWRTVQGEAVYVKDAVAVPAGIAGIGASVQCDHHERPPQA